MLTFFLEEWFLVVWVLIWEGELISDLGLPIIADEDVDGPHVAQLHVVLVKSGGCLQHDKEDIPYLLVLEGLKVIGYPIVDLIF